MTETRKIIKVFLGSPGDLGEERKLAKVAVDHLNEISANYIGYHIELVGWEDTVTRYGRPQESINQDLAQCVLFVGMLWKHWGSRPSADGKYTSGFEEEYSISVDEFKARGRPEICLLFKDVSDDLLNDPGESLKKVLAFKTTIQENKSILYETFADLIEFRKKFERCISYYLHKIREKEEKNSKSENQRLLVDETPEAAGVDSRVDGGGDRGLIDLSGIEFAKRFVSSIEAASQSDTPDPVDVARFRLIAAVLGEQGNDVGALGPHDANLIFTNRDSHDLSAQEKNGLFRSGLNHLSSENTPLWSWVDFDQDRSNRALSVNSLYGPTDKRVGAINAMKLVAEPREYDDVLNREFYHAKWLEASTEIPIKTAALLYLSEFGDLDEIAAIKEEHSRGEYQTTTLAESAVLQICARASAQMAIEQLFELKPKNVDKALLERIFCGDERLDLSTLAPGLNHPSADVRALTIKLLSEAGAIAIEDADKLLRDDVAAVRYEALVALKKHGRVISIAEAKAALVKPKPQQGFGALTLLGSSPAIDWEGDAVFEKFQEQEFSDMDVATLEAIAETETIYNRGATFALIERQFRQRSGKLREDIDTEFSADVQKEIDSSLAALGSRSVYSNPNDRVIEYVRRKLVSRALEIVCKKKEIADLNRVRKILREGKADSCSAVIDYLKKFGTFDDVPLLIELAKETSFFSRMMSIPPSGNSPIRQVAVALISISVGRIDELLSISMGSKLLSSVIISLPEVRFRELGDDTIEQLYLSEYDQVRKAAALKSIQAFPKRKLLQLLGDYMNSNEVRYYNIIHWLDFGCSLSRERGLEAVSRIIQTMWPR